jgi:integrase/recombinase XerD
MNHRPPVSLTVMKAIEGFLNYKTAEGLSARTVESYQRQLQKWREYMGEDKDVARITTSELTAYLNWLRNEYVPHSFGSANKEHLSPKMVLNFGCAFSST